MCAAAAVNWQRCQIEIPTGVCDSVICGSLGDVQWVPEIELYACALCRERFNLEGAS